jgi:hypothetical protein
VLDASPRGLVPAELGHLLREIGRVSARADARRSEAIAEAERSDAARQEGFTSTTAWLSSLTGEPAPICRSQIAVAEALEQMPETREAFGAGEVSESRVKLLAQAQALAPEAFARDEGNLVAQIGSASAKRAPQVLAAWKQTTDPQTAQAQLDRLHDLRALHLSPAWTGMLHLSGDLDPESGLTVLAALRSLSEAANLDPQDARTPAQCRADALVEICRGYLHGQGAGARRRPHVLVTIPWNTLRTGQGAIDTEAGTLSAQAARRLTCDATVSRVLLDPESVPMDLGRAARVVPDSLRRLLDARDHGCTYPGCDMPPRFCDAHHLEHWANGGATNLANLKLLCSVHHKAAHEQDRYHPRR